LEKVMAILCKRMGASHCFLMSFDHERKTIRCEFEYAGPGHAKNLFSNSGEMPFAENDEWFKCFKNENVLDIPDVSAAPEAIAILGKYCGFPDKLDAKSIYSTCLRKDGVLEGAIGYVYTEQRPAFSNGRIAYLMSLSANLFKNVLHRQMKTKTVNHQS